MNLVINASEAIGERSGVITISTGAMDCTREYLTETYLDNSLVEGLYIWLEVSDTGCGMDKETQNRMFEPFFTTKFTGRGLGMAAVMGIVRGHNGALKVYSELGRGTTFKVLFPALEDPAGTHSKSEPGSEALWKGSGLVLLVDDEETIRALGKKQLEALGFQVLVAADGREALEIYRDRVDAIRLVLLDLTMPHMNGEETFRELRRLNPTVRVVISSGYTESEIVSRFAGKGVADCVQKPYTLKTLRQHLRHALGEEA
jgi:CheY-like chemotaxis protein